MVEVLDFILEIFRVQNFASKYTNPLDQFLYALFFPSVIMVIFVVLLTEKMFEQRQGLKMLLTLSFFLFIVVYPPNATYSLYSIMAPILGTVWYLFVILIGFVFFLFSKILPKEGVGGVRGMASTYKKVRGKEFPGFEAQTAARERLTAIDIEIAELKKARGGVESSDQKKVYDEEIAKLVREQAELKRRIQL